MIVAEWVDVRVTGNEKLTNADEVVIWHVEIVRLDVNSANETFHMKNNEQSLSSKFNQNLRKKISTKNHL